jgi:flavin-dependent dehydrogenase
MGWVFRKEGGLNVGIGVHKMGRSDLLPRARRFLDGLGLGRFKSDLKGHHIPGIFLPRVVADGVLLVGDAAGAGNPSTGCGIEDAMKTGILASRTLVDLHHRGRDFTASSLMAYETSLGTIKRLQRFKLRLLRAVAAGQRRGWDTEFWMTSAFRAIVRFDLERFIWSDASRM